MNNEGRSLISRLRKLLRFRLRTILLAVAVVSIAFGIIRAVYVNQYYEQQQVARRLEAAGATCYYELASPFTRFLLANDGASVVYSVDLDSVTRNHPVIDDQTLESIGKLTALESIYVDGQNVSDKTLAAWHGLKGLKILSLQSTAVSHVSQWPDWPLWQLYVSRTNIPSDEISSLGRFTDLRAIHCNSLPVNDHNVAALLKLPKVEWILLRDTRVTHRSWPLFTQQYIRFLDLPGGEGCTIIDGVAKFHFRADEAQRWWLKPSQEIEQAAIERLQSPDVVTTQGDQATIELERYEHNYLDAIGMRPEVTVLRLDSPYIDDSALLHLNQFPNLTALSLEGSWITDAGIRNLAMCPQLEILLLGDTAVSDAGIESLKNSPNLKVLALNGTRITDKALESLHELPHLRVLFLPGKLLREANVPSLNSLPTLDELYVCKIGRWDRFTQLNPRLDRNSLHALAKLGSHFGTTELNSLESLSASVGNWLEFPDAKPVDTQLKFIEDGPTKEHGPFNSR